MKLVFLEKPREFNPKFEVVSCFVRHGDTFLFLHRQDHKPEGGTWSVPAGKIDSDEDVLEAMCRELFEETGLKFEKHHFSEPLQTYVKYPEKDFIYHITELVLENKHDIRINNEEHKAFEWLTLDEALARELIPGEGECIELYYRS